MITRIERGQWMYCQSPDTQIRRRWSVYFLSCAYFPLRGCVIHASWLPLAIMSVMQPLREKLALQSTFDGGHANVITSHEREGCMVILRNSCDVSSKIESKLKIYLES